MIRGYHRRSRRYDDEDDALDETGVVKDGHSIRVPLTMMDSLSPLQRAVAQDSIANGRDKLFERVRTADRDSPVTVVDALGRDGLHQPGFRFLHSGARNTERAVLLAQDRGREDARAQWIADTANAWRTK